MRNWIIGALVAVIAVGGALGAFAASQTVETEANVEVTVWQRVSDGSLYLSTRPEGGNWTTHQTPLDMSQRSPSGRFRQGSAITVAVPVSLDVEIPDAVPESTGTAETTETATPSSTPSSGTGDWIVNSTTDSFDESSIFSARLQGVWSPSRPYPYDDDIPYLHVRCDSDAGLDILVFTDAYLAGNVRTDTIKVEYRFGNGAIQTGYWNESTNNKAAIVPDSSYSSFIASWRNSTGMFQARIYQFSGGVFGTAVFDTAGFEAAVDPVLQQCGH